MVRIQDPEKYKRACEKMRYFEMEGKQCRGLPYDKELLGTNKLKLTDHNVFVRKIPKSVKAQDLEESFKKFGDVKSLKISLNPDYSSRAYGFVCFQTPESAQHALESNQTGDNVFGILRYQPKDRRDMRKAFNNIYVKNFPATWAEEDLRNIFSEAGNIISVFVGKNEKGPFAFICYGNPTDANLEYGTKCAVKAIEEFNEKVIDGQPLYVKEALKKAEREMEKTKEMLRYKNSKKRCNLYVKNFPQGTTKEQLQELFSKYGEIENIKLFPKDGEAIYAFVCFKNPEKAS